MRNPWGLDHYTGPWSANSDLWTPEWKRQAKLDEATDGIFFVPLDDWRTFYTQAFRTHWRDDWITDKLDGNPSTFDRNGQSSEWIGMRNEERQTVVLECNQWSSRMFPPGCKNDVTPQSYAFLVYTHDL